MQDRLAAVGAWPAAIAHEIRNPLTSIAGSVSMLSDAPALNPEERAFCDCDPRIRSFTTSSPIFWPTPGAKQYRFERVNLIPLLEDTLTLLNTVSPRERGHQLERSFPKSEAWVLADGDKLKQVFWNFCENAVRAIKTQTKTETTPKGGTLTVALAERGLDWEMSFADTGPGINPQQTEKIFEPFQSNFEGGTGLGLAIVYQIVQAHEGKVWRARQSARARVS